MILAYVNGTMQQAQVRPEPLWQARAKEFEMKKTINVVKVPVTNLEEIKKMQDAGIPVSSVEVVDGVSVLVYRQEVSGGVVVKATKKNGNLIPATVPLYKGKNFVITLSVDTEEGVEINPEVKYLGNFDVDSGVFTLIPEGHGVYPLATMTAIKNEDVKVPKYHTIAIGDTVHESLKKAAEKYPDEAVKATRDGKVDRKLFIGQLLGQGLVVKEGVKMPDKK